MKYSTAIQEAAEQCVVPLAQAKQLRIAPHGLRQIRRFHVSTQRGGLQRGAIKGDKHLNRVPGQLRKL